MPLRTALALIGFATMTSAALAQMTPAGEARGAQGARSTQESPAAQRDGALMTHANEQKPKAGHSESSAGKSGK